VVSLALDFAYTDFWSMRHTHLWSNRASLTGEVLQGTSRRRATPRAEVGLVGREESGKGKVRRNAPWQQAKGRNRNKFSSHS